MLRRFLILAVAVVAVMFSTAVAAQEYRNGIVSDADPLCGPGVVGSDDVILTAITPAEEVDIALNCGAAVGEAILEGACVGSCIATLGADCILCLIGAGLLVKGDVDCNNAICRAATAGKYPVWYWNHMKCCNRTGKSCQEK